MPLIRGEVLSCLAGGMSRDVSRLHDVRKQRCVGACVIVSRASCAGALATLVDSAPASYLLHCMQQRSRLDVIEACLMRVSTCTCREAGEIMVSAMGDADGKARGGFVLLDQDFKVSCGKLRHMV